MKPLNEVIRVKTELEEKLIGNKAVSAMDIGQPAGNKPSAGETELVIRVFVNDPVIGHKELGVPRVYKGVPVEVSYRKIVLH